MRKKRKRAGKRDGVMNRKVKNILDSSEGKIMVIDTRGIMRNTENENKYKNRKNYRHLGLFIFFYFIGRYS